MAIISTITIQNKKHEYVIKPSKEDGVIRFICKSANIDQDFLAEDIPALILDVPNLVATERQYQNNQTEVVRFRVSSIDKQKIEKKTSSDGFASVSDYLRARALA